MAADSIAPDLLDLRLLPAWLKAPDAEYSDFEGETADAPPRSFNDRRGPRSSPRPSRPSPGGQKHGRRDDKARGRGPSRRPDDRSRPSRPEGERLVLPAVDVRFLPEARALENVTAQIRSGLVAYSVFALARLFLEKPERYSVRLAAPAEGKLFQLGENGEVAADRALLEGRAFQAVKTDYYAVEVTQSEPIKGNFTNVARCRLSGTLLGPTNHHAYQPQLRSLYEQRFSRRMSFAEYQRQIEIVNDPAVVEQWKEQARSVTTFTTTREEPPLTFNTSAETERHFRQHYLPQLVREANEITISGVISRGLQDRGLGRVIEQAWAAETRSPAKMMQELAGSFRGAGLNIFRHRRGMLFVSPVRLRAFGHERSTVSSSVNAILETVAATPGIDRKKLLEQLSGGVGNAEAAADAATPAPAEQEQNSQPEVTDSGADHGRLKLSAASDLRWLVTEGYVIEFNDGSLDLPKPKVPKPPGPVAAGPEVNKVQTVESGAESGPVEETEVSSAPSAPTTPSGDADENPVDELPRNSAV